MFFSQHNLVFGQSIHLDSSLHQFFLQLHMVMTQHVPLSLQGIQLLLLTVSPCKRLVPFFLRASLGHAAVEGIHTRQLFAFLRAQQFTLRPSLRLTQLYHQFLQIQTSIFKLHRLTFLKHQISHQSADLVVQFPLLYFQDLDLMLSFFFQFLLLAHLSLEAFDGHQLLRQFLLPALEILQFGPQRVHFFGERRHLSCVVRSVGRL
mmetsp:Transcript_22724/g.37385  ORF Transcript_22724/g.37385 Transcript_22724/m.37385 type:complete len:205 (-) Transcript_22724:38-652(-)